MSVARTCRRVRLKMANDPRWKNKGKVDVATSIGRAQRVLEKQKMMAMRKGNK